MLCAAYCMNGFQTALMANRPSENKRKKRATAFGAVCPLGYLVKQPRLCRFVLCFKGFDFVGVLQGQADFVEAV